MAPVILWIGLALFASTNVDDLFVLLFFFADPGFRSRQVVLGQYLGMVVLIGLSLLGALATRVIPLEYVGLLGFVPLALGVTKLVALRKPADDDALGSASPGRLAGLKPLAVAAVTVSNGGDNVGAYAPLFATRSGREVALLVGAFLVLTGVWCLVAYGLVSHPRVREPFRKHGRVVVPLALLALGAYLLWGCQPLRVLLRRI
jgi:cadmium resistance protein CadD (predicted permease)